MFVFIDFVNMQNMAHIELLILVYSNKLFLFIKLKCSFMALISKL